jgi:mono/diheme cytochrome c family protein
MIRLCLRPFTALGLAGSILTLASSLSGCFTSTERGGQALYAENCANCHGLDGRGLGKLMPPLAGSDYLQVNRAKLPCIVRQGLRGPLLVNGQDYNGIMPALSPDKVSDADVANILNYVSTAWGNHTDSVFTVQEITDARCY